MSSPSAQRRATAPLLFLLPFTALFLLVGWVPVGRAATWALSGHGSHFLRLLTDRVFLFALVNTLGFTIVFTLCLIPLSLALAMLLDSSATRGRAFLRVLCFSTYLVSPVYVAVIITALLARGTGPLAFLFPAGFDPLAVPWLAMPVVLLASLWMSAGWAMVYLLAALQSVDQELLDAARADGASRPQTFWHVTLPQIAPTLAFVTLASAIGGLQLFELPFVLFQGAGPGNAALTLSMVLFSTTFEQGDLGYASAIGWALALAVALLSAVLLRIATEERGGL